MIYRLYSRKPGEHIWSLTSTFGTEKEVQSFMKHLPERLANTALRVVDPRGIGMRLQ